MAERKNEESLADRSLKLERVFEAPRALVFEACSKKEHIDRWMCPANFTITSSSGDFRVGGKWHSNMRSSDGEAFPMEGVYEKIVENELIVTSHAWIGDDGKPEHWSTMTWRFEDAGPGKTRLTLEHVNLRSRESRDNHIGGWTQCLDKLEALLAEIQGRA
jgi:uncharacterized protein YndB with AHSA1/START domain